MLQRGKRRRLFVATGLLCTIGCALEVAPADTRAVGEQRLSVGGEVEIFSWWTSGGEQDALDGVIDFHQQRVKDAQVTNRAVEFADKAREQLRTRFANGLPPDTFQANAGQDLLGWVITNGRDTDDSFVEELSDLYEAMGWYDTLDEDVLDELSVDGVPYAVPVNVHRINTLFYRKDLFSEYDLELPTSLSDLLELCEQVKAGKFKNAEKLERPLHCLTLGNKWEWTLQTLTFEMILVAQGGGNFYHRFMRGQEEPLPNEVRDTLAYVKRLYCGPEDNADCPKDGYFHPAIDDMTWDEGVRQLSDGNALMAPMGDWAKGLLESKEGGELRAGVDFDVIPFPGTEGHFVFTADTFALPKGATNRDGARSFLKTLGSAQGQAVFNRLKGSIPARMDIDKNEFDPVTQRIMKDFSESKHLSAMSSLLSGDSRVGLQAELTASIRLGNTSIVERYLSANYPLK